jgi:hypothetical protein
MLVLYYEQARAGQASGMPGVELSSDYFRNDLDWVAHVKENTIKKTENKRSKSGLLTSKRTRSSPGGSPRHTSTIRTKEEELLPGGVVWYRRRVPRTRGKEQM